MNLPTVAEVAALLAAVGLGGVVVELAKRRFARRDAARAEPAALVEAEAAAVEAEAEAKRIDAEARGLLLKDYVDQLKYVRRQNVRLERGLRTVRQQVAACEAHRHACDANLATLRAEFDDYVAKHPPATE